jgi:hypothetical protein
MEAAALLVAGGLLVGCGSGPPKLHPPDLDPDAAAQQAMALYDKDSDGNLSAEELQACPGILVSLKNYDADEDGQVSQAEIAGRLQKFVERRVALARLSVTVRLDKRPLAGATVRFVPEPYLGDDIKAATGITRQRGSATMAVDANDLPENQKNIRGIHYGTYRVEITHPEVDVPAKFNTATTLGYETTPGNPYATFDLRTR